MVAFGYLVQLLISGPPVLKPSNLSDRPPCDNNKMKIIISNKYWTEGVEGKAIRAFVTCSKVFLSK